MGVPEIRVCGEIFYISNQSRQLKICFLRLKYISLDVTGNTRFLPQNIRYIYY
jgi:hypothetical protein